MGTSTAERLALAGLFALVPRAFVAMEVHGLEHDAGAPSTIYAISHKRDWDAAAPLPPLLRHRGWRALANDLHFAMRADSFAPGFLSLLVPRPAWFSRVAWRLSLAGILRGAGVHPLDSLHARPLHLWLRDWLATEGDAPAGAVLAPSALASLAEVGGSGGEALARLPLSQLLDWRSRAALFCPVNADVFLPGEPHHRAEAGALATIERELEECATWLRRGGSLYTSPEGRLSPDGRLGPILAALPRLARSGPPETRVQPIMIVYDFMRQGRLRMLVELAPPIPHAGTMTPRALRAALRAGWLRHARFTCTQLAAGILALAAQRNQALTTHELGFSVHQWAAQLAREGRLVDERLLQPDGAAAAASGWLQYAARHRVVFGERTKTGAHWRLVWPVVPVRVAPGDTGYRHAPLWYALNELRDMLDLREAAVA